MMKCSTVTFGNAPNVNRTDVFFNSFLCRHSYKLGRIDGNPIVNHDAVKNWDISLRRKDKILGSEKYLCQ
eukprot:scaffold43634_cov226-Skeletonema_marinoi.AAC.3